MVILKLWQVYCGRERMSKCVHVAGSWIVAVKRMQIEYAMWESKKEPCNVGFDLERPV